MDGKPKQSFIDRVISHILSKSFTDIGAMNALAAIAANEASEHPIQAAIFLALVLCILFEKSGKSTP